MHLARPVFTGSLMGHLHSAGEVILDKIAVTNLQERAGGNGSAQFERGVNLRSLGPATTLVVRDCLFLDNLHSINISGFKSGTGFKSVLFERSRFGANAAPELDLGLINRLEFVASTRLGGAGEFANTTVRTMVLSEPTELPADEGTLAVWRAELQGWGASSEHEQPPTSAPPAP